VEGYARSRATVGRYCSCPLPALLPLAMVLRNGVVSDGEVDDSEDTEDDLDFSMESDTDISLESGLEDCVYCCVDDTPHCPKCNVGELKLNPTSKKLILIPVNEHDKKSQFVIRKDCLSIMHYVSCTLLLFILDILFCALSTLIWTVYIIWKLLQLVTLIIFSCGKPLFSVVFSVIFFVIFTSLNLTVFFFFKVLVFL